jgi:HSP20 family protein
MPVVSKDRIKIYAYDSTVEVKSIDPQKRYHHTFGIPPETDIETVKSTYNNGILEITFNKRGQTKRKGKIIRAE